MSEMMTMISQLVSELSTKEREVLGSVLAARPEPIAIVGIGCRFPGGVVDAPSFWSLLERAVDAIQEVPKSRWDVDAHYDPDPEAPGKCYTRYGGFLDRIDTFDAHFFGISPREASFMDPQQRLLLEVASEAIEDAALSPEAVRRSRTGVFVGCCNHDYADLQARSRSLSDVDAHTLTGDSTSVLAGRLSHVLGATGPSMSLDTACSSSLVALHLAAESLRRGECDVALACGVNVIASPDGFVKLSRMRALSADGRCRTFDVRAGGYARGEGVGVLVLKRLGQAEASRDKLWAVIRGSAINHDGQAAGLTAPNGLAQRDVITAALARAGVSAAEVGLIEAHGTGTPLGDPIELETLAEVYGGPRDAGALCAVGSVKTNIGHLEGAAGVAGVIKAVLAIDRARIPAHLHFTQLNPRIDLTGATLTIPTTARPWAGPRVAAVSSFGISGTNAHVILGEPPQTDPASPPSSRPTALVLSAKTAGALTELARRFAATLADGALPLADVAVTANTGRARHAHRLALVASSTQEAAAVLARFVEGSEAGADLWAGVVTARLRVAFLFPEVAEGDLGVAFRALGEEAPFAGALEDVERALRAWSSGSLRLQQPRDRDESRLARFAFGVALASLWRAWGVTPELVLGDGVGALAAAYTAGVLSLDDAARLAVGPGPAPANRPAQAGVVSPASGQLLDPDALAKPQTWAQLHGDARTLRAGLETLARSGVDLMIEIGASDDFARLARDIVGARGALSSLDRSGDPSRALTRALAAMETRGATIDWVAVHRDRSGRRIRLPTYPFAGERHWLAPSAAPAQTPDGWRSTDRRRPSLLPGLHYEAIAALRSLPLPGAPADERVVLPASLQLARLVEVAADGLGRPKLTAENVVLGEPLVLDGSGDERLVLSSILPCGDGRHHELTIGSVQLASGAPSDAPATRHLTARVRLATGPSTSASRYDATANELDSAAFYARLSALGIRPFGAARWVERACLNEGEIAARIAPPESGVPGPLAVLHAALEVALAVAVARSSPPAGGLVPVVLGVHRLNWFGAAPGGRAYACVARAFEGGPGDPVTLDVRIARLGDHPEPVADLTGLRIDWRSPVQAAGGPSPSVAALVRRVEWAAHPPPTGAAGDARRWLVLGPQDAANEVAEELVAYGQTAVACTPPPDADALARLAEPWDGVVDLRSAAGSAPEKCAHDVIEVIRALSRRTPSARLWVVTRGSQVCVAGDDARGYAGAALWGLMRTVATEQPHLRGGLVDLPAEPSADETSLLVAHVLAGDAPEAALRSGARWVPKLTPAPALLDRRGPAAFRADATYLVTGGLGGLGLAWAGWLAAQGARHLVLAGRSLAGAEARQRIAGWTGSGIAVRTIQADVSRAADVSALLRSVDDGLPPLAGIIHAAGVDAAAVLADVDPTLLERAFAGKAQGARQLLSAVDAHSLDFILFVTSIAGVLGNPGQAAYAAANAFVDGLAAHARARGGRALSLALGPVPGVGLARALPAGTRHRWGVQDLVLEDALAAAGRLLRGDVANVALIGIDEARMDGSESKGGLPAVLVHGMDKVKADGGAAAETPSLLQHLRALAPEERGRALLAQVDAVVHDIFAFDPTLALNPQQRLDELGLDSLLAIDLIRALERAFSTALPGTLMMDCPTVAALAEYLDHMLVDS